MLYQTEPHSDLGAGLIEEGRMGRKRGAGRRVASPHAVRYLPGLRAGQAPPGPFLLGDGVMVTQRFLVPLF